MLAKYFGDCDDGYICIEGAITPTPATISPDGGYECPSGYYCPSGAPIEIPCAPGTYNPNTRQAVCTACDSTMYCPDFAMENPEDCLTGYYCTGGDIYPTPCPAGTYESPASSDDSGDCKVCSATKYCGEPGLLSESGECEAGFVCGEGQSRNAPYLDTYTSPGTSGSCTVGSKCLAGATAPEACSSGTY